jgi:hypothetical protein
LRVDADRTARLLNRDGVEQPNTPVWNPAGYMLNTIESTHVIAA